MPFWKIQQKVLHIIIIHTNLFNYIFSENLWIIMIYILFLPVLQKISIAQIKANTFTNTWINNIKYIHFRNYSTYKWLCFRQNSSQKPQFIFFNLCLILCMIIYLSMKHKILVYQNFKMWKILKWLYLYTISYASIQ